MKKYIDSSWDFKTENTKKMTHCFHGYPAMMIPQVAERLIQKLGKPSDVLFDPYCGSGTSLVEANLIGLKGIATDLNPLATLISKAKTTLIELQILDFYIKDFIDKIFGYRVCDVEDVDELPNFPNIDFWFTPKVKRELFIIKKYIQAIENHNVANFFKVAFSETIRESSLTKNSEFKLVKMKDAQLAKFDPDVFGMFERKLYRNRNGLKDYMNKVKVQIKNEVCNFNSSEFIPENVICDQSIGLIVTSPPYGDSKTTVAYGQFSRLSNQWLDIEDANQVDNNLMGGKKALKLKKFDIKELDETIEKIGNIDEKRVLEVISFYEDYGNSIRNVSKVIKKGGRIAYVVGNRRVKDTELPTDIATAKFFEKYNIRHTETIIRGIPNKKMPKENSPSNVIGQKINTMNNEYIVIMQKT